MSREQILDKALKQIKQGEPFYEVLYEMRKSLISKPFKNPYEKIVFQGWIIAILEGMTGLQLGLVSDEDLQQILDVVYDEFEWRASNPDEAVE
jgi:hypothetical protein